MVAPTIPTVAAGRILQSQNVSGTTHTFPTLSSLTKNVGDLLIAIVFLYDGNSSNAEFSAWGGGFTEFGDFATTTTLSIGCAYKFSTGSETGTFTVTSSGAARSACILMSIFGAHPITIPEAGGYATGTNAAANPGSFNPTGWDVEDTLFIACAGTGRTSTTGSYTRITAAPTSYTDLFTSPDTANILNSIDGAVAFRQLAAASADPGTFTNDTSNTRWAGLTIAVRPAPPQSGSITNVDITLTPVALTKSIGNVSRTLTNVALTLTPVALSISEGGVTASISPVTKTFVLVALTRGTDTVITSISPVIFTLTSVEFVATFDDPPSLQVNTSPNTASLTWGASPTPDVDTYSVFRRSPPTGDPFDPDVDTPIATLVAALTYDDVDLEVGSYEWQVFGIVGVVWSPLDIVGLAAWWDAFDERTIHDTDGLVNQWDDRSGNGNHLTATGSYRPSTGVNAWDGKNVLKFDNDFMDPAENFTSAWTEGTFVIVPKSANILPMSLVSHGARGDCWYPWSGDVVYESFANGDRYSFSVSPRVTRSIYAVRGKTNDWRAEYNGVTVSTSVSNAPSFVIKPRIGGFSNYGVPFYEGDIAEILYYDRFITDEEMATLRVYLAAKWGIIPLTIPGLAAWYDASDPIFLTVDDSGYVSQWDDLSGNRRHLTQGTGSKQPQSGTVTQNGLNVVDFDGDDYMVTAAFTQAQPTTWFVVARNTQASEYLWDGLFGRQAFGMGLSSPGEICGYAGSPALSIAQTTPVTALWTVEFNGVSSVLRRNGTTIKTGDAGTYSLSGGWVLGARYTYNGNLVGWVGEVIMYDGLLSTDDRATIEAYLKAKWGTP